MHSLYACVYVCIVLLVSHTYLSKISHITKRTFEDSVPISVHYRYIVSYHHNCVSLFSYGNMIIHCTYILYVCRVFVYIYVSVFLYVYVGVFLYKCMYVNNMFRSLLQTRHAP